MILATCHFIVKAESKRKLKRATFYIDQKKCFVTKVVVLNKIGIKKEMMKLLSPVGHPGTNASSERRSFKSTQAARRVFSRHGYRLVFSLTFALKCYCWILYSFDSLQLILLHAVSHDLSLSFTPSCIRVSLVRSPDSRKTPTYFTWDSIKIWLISTMGKPLSSLA